MNVRRLLVAWLLGLTLVAAAPVAAWAACAHTGEFKPSDAVKWEVDYAKRTITVTVSLAFYTAGCPANTSCQVSPSTIADITTAIKAYWSGQKYKCFDLIVDVQGRSVGQQSDACDESVDIGLDYSPINPRDFNVTAGAKRSSVVAWSSDDPIDRLIPSHDPANPSHWKAVGRPGDYAHEFGHVIGLHDNYDEKNKTAGPLPGQQENLMTRAQGYVNQEMVNRAVKRSGKVNDDKIFCTWTVSSDGPSVETFGPWQSTLQVKIEDMKLTATKTGEVSGSGTMKTTGTSDAVMPGCTATVNQQTTVQASGTLVGTAPGALLRLTLMASLAAGTTMTIACPDTPPVTIEGQPFEERYCEAMNVMGPFDLPAGGGTIAVSRMTSIGGILIVNAVGNFTVVKDK